MRQLFYISNFVLVIKYIKVFDKSQAKFSHIRNEVEQDMYRRICMG